MDGSREVRLGLLEKACLETLRDPSDLAKLAPAAAFADWIGRVWFKFVKMG